MGKASNEEVEKCSMVPYDRVRMLRIQENQAKMQELGLKHVITSLTSFVASQKLKNKKKLLGTSDTTTEYTPNMDNDGDGDNDGVSSTKVTAPKKVRNVPQKYIPPMSMQKFMELSKKSRELTPTSNELQLGKHLKANHEHTKQVVDDNSATKKLDKKALTIGEMLAREKQAQPQRSIHHENSQRVLNDKVHNSSVSRPNLSYVIAESCATGAGLADIELDTGEKNDTSNVDMILHENAIKDINENYSQTMDVDDQTEDKDEDEDNELDEEEIDEEELLNLHSQSKAYWTSDRKRKYLAEFSRFLGTLACEYSNAPLIHRSWSKVPHKDKLWEYVLGKYIVPDVAKRWVLKSIGAAWRTHKSRVKHEHFENYK